MSDRTDTTPEPSALGRGITALLLKHAGAALVQISALLEDRPTADDDGCGCDEPGDSPRLGEFTWEARFAKQVQVGAVLSVGDRHGSRVVRVTEREESEQRSPFGSTMQVLTFLVVDLDSEEPASIVVAPSEAMRVGVAVPNTVEGLSGGSA